MLRAEIPPTTKIAKTIVQIARPFLNALNPKPPPDAPRGRGDLGKSEGFRTKQRLAGGWNYKTTTSRVNDRMFVPSRKIFTK